MADPTLIFTVRDIQGGNGYACRSPSALALGSAIAPDATACGLAKSLTMGDRIDQHLAAASPAGSGPNTCSCHASRMASTC